MPSRIEDYALIGNLHTAALVAKDGSIDWLCLPRFDSGACFAALLGDSRHGHWQIAPEDPRYKVRRRYREGTLVLETTFESEEGSVLLIDCMVPESKGADMVRVVRGIRGRVPMIMNLVMRFDYGSLVPWVQHRGRELEATGGPDTLHVYADTNLTGDNSGTVSRFDVAERDELVFVLNWHPSHQRQTPRINGRKAVESVTRWWQHWSARSRYEGRWKEDVQRSLLTLKALTHAPTGGIVASPTTSLPEHLGGVRNWDYRFCWLRDATFTLYAMMVAGYVEEARAWREWLLRAVAGMPSDLRIMYGVTGERRLTETTLPFLPGYAGSSPVRVGNNAHLQIQLDVYGEVMDALHLARRLDLETYGASWELQRALLEYLEDFWRVPDEGIWEVRGPRRQFTHSKVMAWVALDRGIKAIERFGRMGPIDRWRRVRAEIHDEVCRRGFNPDVNAFTQFYGSRNLDASLLMLPLVGFLPPQDPRVRGTVEAIEKGLMREGFVMRYLPGHDNIDGLPEGEGAFLACSFWLADNFALQGRHADAQTLFDRVMSIRNDVGLLAEEYDPISKRQLGNFPQAFSHVAMINTARNLSHAGGPAEDRRSHSESESRLMTPKSA